MQKGIRKSIDLGERYTYRLNKLIKGREGRRREGRGEEKGEGGREVETACIHSCLYPVEVRLQNPRSLRSS